MRLQLLFLIIISFGIAVSYNSVLKTQDNRSGAAGTNLNIISLPSSVSLRVGDMVETTLQINTEDEPLVGFALNLSYNPNVLELVSVEKIPPGHAGVSMANTFFGRTDMSDLITDISVPGSIKLASVAYYSSPPTGVINLYKIKFKAKGVGNGVLSLGPVTAQLVNKIYTYPQNEKIAVFSTAFSTSYTVALPPTATPTPIPGDLNVDGQVGMADFLFWRESFLRGTSVMAQFLAWRYAFVK